MAKNHSSMGALSFRKLFLFLLLFIVSIKNAWAFIPPNIVPELIKISSSVLIAGIAGMLIFFAWFKTFLSKKIMKRKALILFFILIVFLVFFVAYLKYGYILKLLLSKQLPDNLAASDFELKSIRDNSSILLVDVREPEEFEYGHFKGAVNYRYVDLLKDKDVQNQLREQSINKKVVFYCLNGFRSNVIYNYFIEVDPSMETKWLNLVNNPDFDKPSNSDLWLGGKGFISSLPSKKIKMPEFEKLYQGNLYIIDARNELNSKVFSANTDVKIPMSLTSREQLSVISKIPTEKEIVIFCDDDISCFFSDTLSINLINRGYDAKKTCRDCIPNENISLSTIVDIRMDDMPYYQKKMVSLNISSLTFSFGNYGAFYNLTSDEKFFALDPDLYTKLNEFNLSHDKPIVIFFNPNTDITRKGADVISKYLTNKGYVVKTIYAVDDS
jgi:rhodanese-related sulfurtransferase